MRRANISGVLVLAKMNFTFTVCEFSKMKIRSSTTTAAIAHWRQLVWRFPPRDGDGALLAGLCVGLPSMGRL
jgi:hypothetical protein